MGDAKRFVRNCFARPSIVAKFPHRPHTELRGKIHMLNLFFGLVVCALLVGIHFLLRRVVRLLRAQLRALRDLQPVQSSAFEFAFYEITDGQERRISMAIIAIDVVKTYKIKPVDKAGNTAKLDGAPVWALSDPAMGTLVVAEDGLTAELTPAGALGNCELQVSGDADLGEGVEPIMGVLPLEFVGGKAVAIEVSEA